MSWDIFIKRMNEEVNNKPAVTRKNNKKSKLIEEITEDQIDEKISDVLKKVGSTVKTGWRKLTGKIKEVATRGFKFGVAIAKNVSGKFIAFNKSGDILLPPAEKIDYERAPFGEQVLTAGYKTPAGQMDIYISETFDFGFGAIPNGPKGFGIMNVIEPKQKPLKESRDYKLSGPLKRFLNEDEDLGDDEEELKAKFLAKTTKLVFSGGTSALEKTEDQVEKVRPVEVNYQHFKKMLSEMMERVESGKVLKGGMIKNIAIYAPTGWGKSMIIKQAATEKGFHFLPLELQKIALEVIQGFPFLEKVEDASDEQKEDRLNRAKTIVKIAPSQYLPPSGDVDNWLLFFDEFNRADTEKMAAVMNLLLTGELGGAAEMIRKGGKITKIEKYHLPKKIIIVLAMNTGEQKGVYEAVNAVNNLDIATLERVQEVVFGKYHAASWSESFATKPFVAEFENGESAPVTSRIPAIIMNYIAKLTQKKSEDPDVKSMEAPFLLPIDVASGKGGGGSRTMSPRAWTMVADHMIETGYLNFSKLSQEEKNKYKEKAESIKKELEKENEGGKIKDESGKTIKLPDNINDYLFAAYMEDSQNQVALMSLQAAHFGDKGVEIVYDIIKDYKKKLKEGVSHYDILFNYKNVRPLVKKNFTNLGFGTYPRFLAQLLYSLEQFKTTVEAEAFMKKNKWEKLPKVDSIEEQLLKTFQALKKDLDIPDDDFASFLHLIDTRAKKGHEIIRSIHQIAMGEGWEEYEEAIKMKMKTKSQVEKELEQLFNAEDKGKTKEKTDTEEKNESINMDPFFKKLKIGGVK